MLSRFMTTLIDLYQSIGGTSVYISTTCPFALDYILDKSETWRINWCFKLRDFNVLVRCTTIDYTPTLSKSYKTSEGRAYIYGCLERTTVSKIGALAKLALVIERKDDEPTKFYFVFNANNRRAASVPERPILR